jgi:hypothetical protein
VREGNIVSQAVRCGGSLVREGNIVSQAVRGGGSLVREGNIVSQTFETVRSLVREGNIVSQAVRGGSIWDRSDDIAPDERISKLNRAMEQAERLADSILLGD